MEIWGEFSQCQRQHLANPLKGVSSGNRRSRVSSVLTNNSIGEASQKYESGKWKDGIVSVPKAASLKRVS